MSVRDPFEGFPAIGLTPQPPPVSQGFSSKGMKPRPESRFDYGNLKPIEVNLGAHTPQLSRVSKQDYSELQRKYANELLRNRVKNHLYQPLPNAAPSPAPQSMFDNMYSEANRHATNYWSQRQHQPHQQQHQQQQRPHTIDLSSLKINNALRTLGLSLNRSPTYADVKEAYKMAAFGNHPDKVADRTEKFIEANDAYVLLINSLRNKNGGNMAKTGGNNTIKRRHKKHKHAKKTRGKTRGKTYRKTRKNTTKRRR